MIASTSIAAGESGTTGAGGGLVHTVAAGETLWGIARDYGVELTELISRNPQIKNPNLILPGEQVTVG